MKNLFEKCAMFIIVILSLAGAQAQDVKVPEVSIAISSPVAGTMVGGDNIKILHNVISEKGVAIRDIQTQITEIGEPTLSLSLSIEPWQANEQQIYPVIWNSLPMHNGPCRITSRVVYQKGKETFSVISSPVNVIVTNLWITAATPANAFFALKVKESQTVSVDFEHYKASGPYRVEYTFFWLGMDEELRKVVHENVTSHHDQCIITADKESFPWGAYISFNIKVSCAGDESSLISPSCKVVTDDTEIITNSPNVKLVYALSEPPANKGLTILCYSHLELITSVEGLSEQCRDWDNPISVVFNNYTSFRSIYVGRDNHTDNRGRSPLLIMPWS